MSGLLGFSAPTLLAATGDRGSGWQEWRNSSTTVSAGTQGWSSQGLNHPPSLLLGGRSTGWVTCIEQEEELGQRVFLWPWPQVAQKP